MSAAAEEPVLIHIAEGVAALTLNRPDRMNAINGQLSRALNRALDTASRSPEVRVILLQGAGRGFCAGADAQVLDEYAADPKAPNSGSGRLRYGELMRLPKPVIAAVHGACAGVGLALACCADIRLAASSAFFLAPFAGLGLSAEVGLGWLLPRLVGTGSAMDMLLGGQRLTADDARSIGLVRHVFPEATFMQEARAYAVRLAASGAPAALRLIKQQVYDAWGQDFATAEEAALRLTFQTLESPDFTEAMAARRQKRPPVFAAVTSPFLSSG
ncbi:MULTISPECIES: enoyl-CoA hydratase-related protein [unclassified Azospirillum]|uniref:enoyl-CoA hydratase-related protein n=1 Tax=unclassified Azospirillum TaxID=2630922 RepID=UPI000B6543F0|nr:MULTISPECIES: enoyl-CoA hydratase-related protein [unclassified Azospirillum]SNT07955.1 Enoyl-CoA hydratase [Azospirillum sp. RU38E]SNT22662.1 Enoyl-CoA hydratase [Azospirillum sp. RU37A]